MTGLAELMNERVSGRHCPWGRQGLVVFICEGGHGLIRSSVAAKSRLRAFEWTQSLLKTWRGAEVDGARSVVERRLRHMDACMCQCGSSSRGRREGGEAKTDRAGVRVGKAKVGEHKLGGWSVRAAACTSDRIR